jgi:hypothetical protein
VFNKKPYEIESYGMNLYLLFREELISGGAPEPSQALFGLLDLLSRWKETNDPSYLDLFLTNACHYKVTFGHAILWEVSKAASMRSSGKFTDRSGKKAQAARVEFIRKHACQWIFILRTYCGIDAEDAKELAAARLYEEYKHKVIKVELKPDSLGKLYNDLYTADVLDNLREESDEGYWTEKRIQDYKDQFKFSLPAHLEYNARL